jgi:hypothetical protein
MKLRDFFAKAVEVGIDNDPRGREGVLKTLAAARKEHDELKDKDREFFDMDRLTNPYADSRILWGTGDEEVSSALVGVDIEVGEVMLADALRARGEGASFLMAHHPEGWAYAKLHEVMAMQSDILGRFGVPINKAESLMAERMREVERRLLPVNHMRAVDAARIMKHPLLNLHTPADNMVFSHLQRLFDGKKPERLDDIVDLLLDIPEYRYAKKMGAGPLILLGEGKRTAGRVFVDMTGGTEGSKKIFESLSQSGINTLVCMHLSDDHRTEAEKHHLNVVIAGHISSDNLGINLLLDAVIGDAPFAVIECSGFKRVARP